MKINVRKPAFGPAGLILRETVRSFQANGDFEISAALATYGFFAFLPLLFFLGYLFGNFALFSRTVIHGIDQMIGHMFPRTDHLITRDLYFFTTHRLVWAVVGLSLVLVPVMSLTDTLRNSFSRIFSDLPALSFIRGQLNNLRAALIMVLFFIGLILGEILYSRLFLSNNRPPGFLSETLPVFVGALLFLMVLYGTFPPRRLKPRPLLAAAFLSAFLLLAMREIFSVFIAYTPGFGEAFGPLKSLFIMMVWVYYCFLVILFGAELMVHIGKQEALLLQGLFLRREGPSAPAGRLLGKFVREYTAGEVVFHQGETGECLYYIWTGSVTISGEAGIIRSMGPGEYFGEMSMLLDAPRTATVTAASPVTRLIGISRKNFEVILRDNPRIVLAILKEMTRRLKESGRRPDSMP